MWIVALTLCLASPEVLAAPPSSRGGRMARKQMQRNEEQALIAAATANAYSSLRRDVERNWITPTMQVEEFIRRTKSDEALRQSIRRADQIGGPRWIDDQRCQIKLEISGQRLARTLVEIAQSDPQRSPIPPAEVERRLADWKNRVFTATGTSIPADLVQEIRPAGNAAWQSVNDPMRVAAINAARDNAVQRVLEEIRPIRLGADSTVGDVLAQNQNVAARMRDWLRSQPVTSLQFKDDLQVEYTLSVGRRALLEEFFSAAQQAGLSMPSEDAIAKLRDQLWLEMTDTTGVATARREGSGESPRGESLVPQQAPAWIFEQIDAEGVAPYQESSLRTKQEAEDRATDSIRAKLLSMPLARGLSVREAADKDPRVKAAVQRAISRVRIFKVDYNGSDGSVRVKMHLDPREFWYDLNRP